MSAPSGRQGPLRAAVAVLVVGFLVVWLVKPIGNPCPDLASLPSGSSASSSPSFSPPGSRTCTYTVPGGTQATAKHVPWLDWIVLALLAAAVAAAVRAASPEGRRARAGRSAAAPGRRRAGSPGGQAPPASRSQPEPVEPAERRRRPPASRDPDAPRDAAERERARRERAARARDRRGPPRS